MKIYIIAGEASGDIYGASLIESIKKHSQKQVEFFGIGGENMQRAGINSLFPMHEISIMGFFEILPHIPNVLNRIDETVAEIKRIKPDVVVTIDSPGFCCRVAKKLQGEGIKLVHYVAPTVWAYKPGRAKKFANLFNHLFVILPFEPTYFEKEGLDCTYIGHPIVETKIPSETYFRKNNKISVESNLITIMPGSRSTEIKKILPIFIDAAKIIKNKNSDVVFAIATIENLKGQINSLLNKENFEAVIVSDKKEKLELLKESNAAIVKSGTGSFEVMLCNCPMIIAYKVSYLSYIIIKNLIKIRFANLINIISDKEIIPEFIQNNCTAEKISSEINRIIQKKEVGEEQIAGTKDILKKLGLGKKNTPSDKAANALLKML